jgi:hypothetical protein
VPAFQRSDSTEGAASPIDSPIAGLKLAGSISLATIFLLAACYVILRDETGKQFCHFPYGGG